MAKLEDAKKTRKAARGWLSRAVKALDKQVKHDPIVKDDLEDALSMFDDRLAAVDSAQNGVELLLPEDELDADLDVAGSIRETAWAVRKNTAREIAIIKATERTDNQNSVTSSYMKMARLPKLELPTFSGIITEWQSFWDKFYC